MAREVSVGLEENPLTPGELEELLVGFEERIRRALRRRLGRRLGELEIVVEGVLEDNGRRLIVRVDARAAGRLIAPVSYDEVLAEAIEEAGGWLRERLLKRRRDREVGERAGEPGEGSRHASSGDGA